MQTGDVTFLRVFTVDGSTKRAFETVIDEFAVHVSDEKKTFKLSFAKRNRR